ncbi:MAG: hypothetical protein M0Z31_08285 [Clostridia bacterium]|nr:hypothetical protein [Clostridia bacterium]
MVQMFTGPTGSGKTTRLLEVYEGLGKKGIKTDDILVLVKGASNVSQWRASVKLPVSGPMQIYTYFGWVQKEVGKYWPLIEGSLPGGLSCLEPTFMTAEASHYLMALIVDRIRAEGGFPEVKATAQQIAIQLIDNLNQGAINGLTVEEIKERLVRQHPGDLNRRLAYQHAFEIMGEFREKCLQSRCLDYSLAVELYNQYLLTREDYIKGLTGAFRYLLVDNLEEMVPTAQDLILVLLDEMEEAFLAFNPDGGYGTSFGADPVMAKKVILPRCKVAELGNSHTSSRKADELAAVLATVIGAGDGQSVVTNFADDGSTLGAVQQEGSHGQEDGRDNGVLAGSLVENLRGDMFHRVGKEIVRLLGQGVTPGDIVVIAPMIDKVMEFSLGQYLKNRGYALANLTRNRQLLDQPFGQALITLALLVNPGWRLQLNFSALVQTLGMVIKTDPVRSALLAEQVFRHRLELPDLDQVGLRPRIGFDKGDKYDFLKKWIEEKKEEQPELDLFFQQAFGELLAPLMPGENDLLACRQLIDSVMKFRKVMERFPGGSEMALGESFIDLVLRGTLAAETLFRPPQNKEQVILATPYTFLFSPYITSTKYQFWMDVSGEHWMWGNGKELSNPYLLSRQWAGDQIWNDEADQRLRREQLVRTVKSMLGKCGGSLYIAASYLSSQGHEQEGQLAQWLEDVGGEWS